MAPAYPSSCFNASKYTKWRLVPSRKKQNSCLKISGMGCPLAQGAEEPVQMGENLNPPQIARKEAQSGASSQLIGGGFNVINQGSGMTVGCVSIGHVCTPFGLGVVR